MRCRSINRSSEASSSTVIPMDDMPLMRDSLSTFRGAGFPLRFSGTKTATEGMVRSILAASAVPKGVNATTRNARETRRAAGLIIKLTDKVSYRFFSNVVQRFATAAQKTVLHVYPALGRGRRPNDPSGLGLEHLKAH